MRKTTFLKHLDQLGEEELRSELTSLYNSLKTVRQYYQMELGSRQEREKRYALAKKDIASKYKTKSLRKPRRPRIQKVKKILSELEKLSVFSHELIDIYLFDVETALGFARTYDYFTQVLYNNISLSFEKACKLIAQHRLEKEYAERCKNILVLSRYIKALNENLAGLMADSFNSKKD